MATTTARVLLQKLGTRLGGYISSVTTSAGNGGGTTVVDTALKNYFGGDDSAEGWWLVVREGDSDGEIRRVGDGSNAFTFSSGTLTVATAYSNQIATDLDYELFRYDMVDLRRAINNATRRLFANKALYIERRDETLFVDNLLSISGFEPSGIVDNWSAVGTPTGVAGETSRVWHGGQSLKMSGDGVSVEGYEQNVFSTVNPHELVGKTIHVRGFVWAATAFARLRLTFDGSAFSADTHSGNEQWEELKIDAAFEADSTELTVSCEVMDTNNAYFDDVVAYVSVPVTRYTIPTTIRELHQVEQQMHRLEPNGLYLPITHENSPIPSHIIRLRGIDTLSTIAESGTVGFGSPIDDTDTIEVDGDQAELVVAQAAVEFWNMLYARTGEDRHLTLANRAQAQVDDMMPTHRMAGVPVAKRRGWNTSRDSSNYYLELQR